MAKKKRFKKYFLTFTLLIFLVTSIFVYYTFFAVKYFEGEKIIIVSKGMSLNQVADSLEANGIIRSKFLFGLAGKYLGLEKRIRAGKYLFHEGLSNLEILKDLKTGNSALLISVTIPEGLRIIDQSKLFSKILGVDSAKLTKLTFDEDFVKSLGHTEGHLEGFLLPDTYHFYWQTDEEEIIRRLVDAFWNFLNDSLQADIQMRGLSIKEILTMASIIEGETNLDSERAKIAGVYYNRLRKKIPLQADPTIQYIIKDSPRRLTYSDLKINSRYNTYLFSGLPPGPINNPGRASILAAIFPEKHDYLYFVVSLKGGHEFSKTYDEHQRAVNRYRRMRDIKISSGN